MSTIRDIRYTKCPLDKKSIILNVRRRNIRIRSVRLPYLLYKAIKQTVFVVYTVKRQE